MEALEGLFDSSWWAADLAFVAGMGIAFNASKVQKGLEGFGQKLAGALLEKSDKKMIVPQHIVRSIKDNSPKITYYLIKYTLLFCAVWNVLVNVFSSGKRFSAFNLLYLYYPYFTVYTSAKDILLDDDIRKDWKEHAKRLYIAIPFKLEASKVFPTDLTESKARNQLLSIDKLLLEKGMKAVPHAIAAIVLHQLLPPILFVVACPLILNLQNTVNMMIDLALDKVFLNVYKNRYSHIFGNYWGIVNDDEKHDYFGRQYQYFTYSNKPLEKICKKQFFDEARKKHGATVRQALVATYLGRGAIVTGTLFTLNMIDQKELGVVKAFLPYVAYYGIHAGFSYFTDWYVNERWLEKALDREATSKDKDKLVKAPLRAIVFGIESVVAGYLFYKPMMDLCFNSSN